MKHGHTPRGQESPTYCSWRAMINRCRNRNDSRYNDYGGRGITVCGEWLRFEAFLQDMGMRPENTTLDRKNNELGYCKSNCQWSTAREQVANKRVAKDCTMLTHNGETFHIAEWARRTGIKRATISQRLHRGWTVKEALCLQ